MLQSKNNPIYAHLSDNEVSNCYIEAYRKRDADIMSDEELDKMDALLFWLDDELCSRGLDLPII